MSDPYEIPETPEISIDTSDIGLDETVQRILLKLEREGYLRQEVEAEHEKTPRHLAMPGVNI
ncbi:MAG: hypothetical protein Q8L39_06425 [Burkholderiales bacterium]|nr:hypothetical protein [Burkholderiales bacterium]